MASPRCILKLAHPTKLLALNAAGVIRVTLYLLLAACHTSNRQSLPRLTGLGYTPVGVDCFAIDHCLAVTAIVIEVTHSLARHLRGPHKSRQEVSASPDLGPQSILRGNTVGRRGARSWRGVRCPLRRSLVVIARHNTVLGSRKVETELVLG